MDPILQSVFLIPEFPNLAEEEVDGAEDTFTLDSSLIDCLATEALDTSCNAFMITLMLIPMLFVVQAFQPFASMTPRMKPSVPMILKPAMTMIFCSHIPFTARHCFIDKESRDVGLAIKRAIKLKARESRAFKRAVITLNVSSSHQSVYAKLLDIQSRLPTLVSDVNLLITLTFVNHAKFSTECMVIGALAANC